MANYTVTNTDDSGAGSLRAAITAANLTAAADTIDFTAGLSGTITLTTGELAIINDLTINGDTNNDKAADITISGNDASRVFNISGATTDTSLLSLNLTNGYSANPGGAVYADDTSSLHIDSSTIQQSASQRGGGLYVRRTDLTVVDSTITGNSSTASGGGIANYRGAVTLTNTTISGNSADGNGGGLYWRDSSSGPGSILTISNSTIVDNRADADGNAFGIGGGSQMLRGTVNINNSVISGNSSGAIAADVADDLNNSVYTSATLSITSSFTGVAVTGAYTDGGSNDLAGGASGLGSLANNGGAVQTHEILTGSALISAGVSGLLPLDVHDVDNDANTAETLPLDANGNARISGTLDIGATEFVGDLVVDNATDENDGDFSAGNFSLREATGLATSSSTISFDASLTGSTIFLDAALGQLSITGGMTIDGDFDGDNVADITIDADSSAGADDADSRIFNIDGGTGAAVVTLNGLILQNGQPIGGDEDGGAILVNAGDTLTLINSTVQNSSASSDGGGISSEGSLTIIDSTITGNTATEDGGGIDIDEGGIDLTNTIISNNVAGNYGGGIFLEDGTSYLTNAIITGNSAAYQGGGVYTSDYTTFSHSIISNNTVTGYLVAPGITGGYGGGIYNNAALRLSNSTIADNTASGTISHGGGVDNHGALYLGNVTVSGNSAGTSGGGIENQGLFAAVNTTIANNSATAAASVGGGITSVYGQAYLYNTTITANSAAGTGGGIYGCSCSELTNSLLIGNTAASGADFDNLPTLYGANIIGTGIYADATMTGTTTLAEVFGGAVLADNGGPVQTIGIARNGSADNTGSDAALVADIFDFDGDNDVAEAIPVDARGVGFARILNGQSDIGALENLPATAADDAFATTDTTSINGASNVFDANPASPDRDKDSPLAVTAINGSSGDVGIPTTLPSGALLQLNADGTFNYNPNGAFEHVVQGATATDTFTYQLNADDTATVTVTLTGLDNDDTLVATLAVEAHDGGVGNNTVSFENAAFIGVTANLGANTSTGDVGDGDTFVNIQNFLGSPFADLLTGDAGVNILDGGLGDDTLDGGDGIDTASFASFSGPVNVNLNLSGPQATGAGNDTLANIENLTGGIGADRLIGATGANGTNVLSGNDGNDNLYGIGGNDTLNGGQGNDFALAGAGADTLNGNDGDDILKGGDDNDTLTGGVGRDNLYGQAGADTFTFNDASETGLVYADRDIIRDFSQADGDLIDLSGIDAVTGGADDAFIFLGTFPNTTPTIPFTNIAGQLFAVNTVGGQTVVWGDVDGDGTQDFTFVLDGSLALTDSDFIL